MVWHGKHSRMSRLRISAAYGFGTVETGRLVCVETFPALMVVAEPAEEALTVPLARFCAARRYRRFSVGAGDALVLATSEA
jgi:hypothetical protein